MTSALNNCLEVLHAKVQLNLVIFKSVDHKLQKT